MFKCTGLCALCGKCHKINPIEEYNNREDKLLFVPKDFISDISGNGYGIAFDIGTTTVVGILWDFFHGELVNSVSMANPQIVYGSDVISRITFSLEENNLKKLQTEIIICLNNIIGILCRKNNIEHNLINSAVICGNTTMSHILLGISVKGLATAPFEASYTGTVYRSAAELGIQIKDTGNIMIVPNIGGHIGGDITSGILAVGLDNFKYNSILIDIGTNGEVVINYNGKMLACSTAAGPAFEGASIYQGMRAAEGAIESVKIIDNDIDFKVIGNVPPVGICGSGLIDIVAELLRHGIIDKSGRMLSSEEFEKKYGKSLLCERLVEDESGRKIIIVCKKDSEDIVVTQKDIREVQLAKAAIVAGIKILLNNCNGRKMDIDCIYIAGAFGSYIDKMSAVTIGLLPNFELERIHSVGNAAGVGAIMTLASSKHYNSIQKIPQITNHIDLSREKDFQKEFINAMAFK